MSPIVAYLYYALFLRMCLWLRLSEDSLHWRTPLRAGVAPLTLITSVGRVPKAHWTMRVIEVADGQKLFIGEGPEFDRLMRALADLGVENVDLDYR